MLKRTLILAYGVACYAMFFATFLYAIGLRRQLRGAEDASTRPRDVALGTALLVDLALLGLFAVQHSVMARPASSAG